MCMHQKESHWSTGQYRVYVHEISKAPRACSKLLGNKFEVSLSAKRMFTFLPFSMLTNNYGHALDIDDIVLPWIWNVQWPWRSHTASTPTQRCITFTLHCVHPPLPHCITSTPHCITSQPSLNWCGVPMSCEFSCTHDWSCISGGKAARKLAEKIL